MTRFLTATALTALMATGATAQTAGEAATIEKYLPGIQVETLSDDQVVQLNNLAKSGNSESEKALRMRGLVSDQNFEDYEAVEYEPTEGLTDGQRAEISKYAPELDVSTLSDMQVQRLQNVITSGDEGEINRVLNSFDAG